METFQLSEKLLKKIANLILAKKNTPLKKIVKDIHFADMAEIINELNEDQGVYLIKLLSYIRDGLDRLRNNIGG